MRETSLASMLAEPHINEEEETLHGLLQPEEEALPEAEPDPGLWPPTSKSGNSTAS